MRLFLVVASFLTFASLTAAGGEERIAMVVANSTFAGGPVLADARASAETVGAALERAGFKVTSVNDANRDAMRSAFRDFLIELDGGGAIGLFYYIGYGAEVGGANYLLPVDAGIANLDDISLQAMSLTGILDSLNLTSATKIVVLDTRWSNGRPGASLGAPLGPASVVPAPGTIVTFSSTPGMAADSNAGTSAFAQAFATALGRPDADIATVLWETGVRVSQATDGRQVPWTASGLSGTVSLGPPAETPVAAAPPAMPEPSPIQPASPPEVIVEIPVEPPLDPALGAGSGGFDEYPPSEPFPMDSASGSGGGGSGGSDTDFLEGLDFSGQASGSAVDGSGMISEVEKQRLEEEMARRNAEELERQRYEEALRAEAERKAAVEQALGNSLAAAPGAEQPPVPTDAGGEMVGAEPPMASGGGVPGVDYVFPPPSYSTEFGSGTLGGEMPLPVPYPPAPDSMAGGVDGAIGLGSGGSEPAGGAAMAEDNLGAMYEDLEPASPLAEAPPLDGAPPLAAPPLPPTEEATVPPAPDGEIMVGGGDAVDSGEIAPGGGGNPYLDITTMAEPDAWAAVSGSGDPWMFQVYLFAFPSGAHVVEAGRRISELTNVPSAAGDPMSEPSAPPAAPAPPAETTIARHPTLDAPEQVVVSEVFTVSVALTEEHLTPDVTARAAPTTAVTPEGALEFSMPAQVEEWPIDIDLLAAGFDLADGGKWSRRVTLYKAGDSDFARFEIKARAITDASKPRQLMARFYHAGRFLGSASRPVTVLRTALPPEASIAPAASTLVQLAAVPPAAALASDAIINYGADDDLLNVPDLDVTIHYDDPDNLGSGLIVIHSPHIAGPVSAEFTTPAGMAEWLNTEYMRLVQLGLKVRGATSLVEPTAQDPASQKRFNQRAAEGFGDDLYRNYVPQPFKDVFWSLKLRGLIHSIQITSNSPVLPWELVRPHQAEGAQSDGFLGISYRVARWAPRTTSGQIDQPLNRMAFTGVATVAPSYENNQELPFQQVEIDALSKLAGFRMIGGDFNAFEKMVGEVSTGFIHFSGHGEINDPGTGAPVFAIRLADQLLDPNTWRALTFAPRDQGNPFYFFNACDTGQAASLGGFVQGWGPAILASGASGFIGGMWPLTDRTAASFSTEFYSGVTGHLADGPVYLAEVLQGVRKRFYETGDPTYLAYTFYGNANLQVVAQ